MLDENNNPIMSNTPDATPPEEGSNRTFLIVGGIMAGLVFLTLVCLAVYFLVIAPRTTAQRSATQTAVSQANAQVIQQMTSTAEAALWTATSPPTPLASPSPSPVPMTPTSSPTPVIAVNTATVTDTTDPATLIAMQTQLSGQMTATALALATSSGLATPSAMPRTGFFDEIGLPGLIVLALALIAVIFLARRLRKAPAK
jgi:ABC-type antimicrobial peptide transport system permease subunit